MNLHLVTYDLRKPGRDYATLFAAIKALGKAIKPLQSTWIVATNGVSLRSWRLRDGAWSEMPLPEWERMKEA